MKYFIFAFTLFLLSACAALPASSDQIVQNTPVPVSDNSPILSTDDAGLAKGEVYFDQVQILSMESYPPQFNLNLTGNLPTPCHKLHVEVGNPDAQNQIRVDAYSVVDSDQVCAQVLQPFEVTVPLGSFPSGRYTLWLNNEMIGEIQG